MLCSTHPAGWNHLSENEQLQVTRAALQLALHTIAGQADLIAAEMERGMLSDLGSADALRLLATTLRISTGDPPVAGYDLVAASPAGRA